MANEQIITELIVTGAQQSVQNILAVQNAITNLSTQLTSVDRVRTPQLEQGLQNIARLINELGAGGTKNVNQLAQAFVDLAAKLEASRVRTGQLRNDLAELNRTAGNLKQFSTPNNLGVPDRLAVAIAAAQATAARASIVRQREEQAQTGRQVPTQLMSPERFQLARDAAAFTAARNAIIAQQAAAATLQGRLQALVGVIKQTVTENFRFGQSSIAAADGIKKQGDAAHHARTRGITYLSVLSAVHAASFLTTNQTFSMIGSFATLGLAFGKMGLAASGAGLVLGGVLGIFGQINQAAQLIQQSVLGATATLLKVGVGTVAALTAAGVAGIKTAADVETQLAAVRAFGNASAEELRTVATQASEFAVEFGVSAASVVEATSLFARAGGTVKEAIDGATEAIVKLQVASAGELTAAQSAIILSAALKQFNLTGDQSVRVADNLAAAFQGSALSAIGVQQAFIQAAPGAAAMKISIEDLSVAIALIGDQLVKGTTTGTAFKQFLLDLINPTGKVKELFNEYGISVQNVDGTVRSLDEILGSLNAALGDEAIALGRVTEAQRNQAVGAAFGSRAFLAGIILSRRGAEGLQRYRDELAKTTTSNIVDVLLLPLNKQLERLGVVVTEVGSQFGGALLQPIRSATVAAIDFFKGLIPLAELLGQVVSVVVTGQGFEALQVAIDRLVGNNALSSFLIELVNTFRNVRDVIVSQIVPAIQDFIRQMGAVGSEDGRIDDVADAFDGLNKSIQFTGAVIAGTIKAFGDLIVHMIHNEGRGKELRETLVALATAITSKLVSSLVATGTAIVAATALMPIFAKISLVTAQVLLRLVGVIGRANEGLIDFSEKIARAIATLEALNEVGRLNFGPLLGLEERLAGISKAAEEMRQKSIKAFDVDGIIKAVDDLSNGGLDALIDKAKLAGETLATDTKDGIKVFEDALGEIPNALANITAETEQRQRELNATMRGGIAAPFPEDGEDKLANAIARQRERIAEAARDITTRLRNLAEDSEQTVTNTVARALERIGDISERANDQLDELKERTAERIKDIFENISDRRAERGIVDDFKKDQEDQLTIFQRSLDLQDQILERSLDREQALRARNNEDSARIVDQQFEDVATGYQKQQQAAERAFTQIQQTRERAFDAAQQVEEQAFSRSLQTIADARDFAQQLAGAKTPEERAQINAARTAAVANTAFRQGQENQLTAFRKKQEDKKREFTDNSEAMSRKFKEGQETVLLDFRRSQELKLLSIKRNAEDVERTYKESQEEAAFNRRLAREDELQARRRTDETKFQAFQDGLEDQRAKKDAQRVQDESDKQGLKLIATAEKQIGEIVDTTILQFAEQSAALERQIRNVLQVLTDIKDSIPPELFSSVVDRLTIAESEATAGAEQLRAKLQEIRDSGLLNIQQKAAVSTAELLLKAPTTATPIAGTTIPIQVLAAQTMTVASLVLPTGFSQAVSQAVLFGIQQAVSEGLVPEIDLDPITDGVQSMARFFRG